MQVNTGTIIISSKALNNDFFEASAIVIASANEGGHTGFIFNRRFERKLNELVEFSNLAGIPLYAGGPVYTDHLYMLHQAGQWLGGDQFATDSFLGGDFQKGISMLTNGQLSDDEIKIFIGYCGWNTGELEAEIAEGSWIITDAPMELVFQQEQETTWQRLFKEYGS